MSDSQIREIQNILTEIDELLRERLEAAGLNIGHVLLAIAPDGAGVVRSNVGPDGLGDMAELLAEVADGSAIERPENEPFELIKMARRSGPVPQAGPAVGSSLKHAKAIPVALPPPQIVPQRLERRVPQPAGGALVRIDDLHELRRLDPSGAGLPRRLWQRRLLHDQAR